MILNISLHTFDKKKIKEDAKKLSESYHYSNYKTNHKFYDYLLVEKIFSYHS